MSIICHRARNEENKKDYLNPLTWKEECGMQMREREERREKREERKEKKEEFTRTKGNGKKREEKEEKKAD